MALLWFTRNRLKGKPSKTELLFLKSPRQHVAHSLNVCFGATRLTPEQSAKLLGVYLDPNLTWERHISMITQRCYYVLIGLARMQRGVPLQTKKKTVGGGTCFSPYTILFVCLGQLYENPKAQATEVYQLCRSNSDWPGEP